MSELLRGVRPDVTPAQTIAFVLVGLPSLLVLFGVELSGDQSEALDKLLALGIALITGDVLLRGARNLKDGKVQAAALMPVPAPAQGGTPGAPVEAPVGPVDREEAELLASAVEAPPLLPDEDADLIGVNAGDPPEVPLVPLVGPVGDGEAYRGV